jgi:hypothetical protein
MIDGSPPWETIFALIFEVVAFAILSINLFQLFKNIYGYPPKKISIRNLLLVLVGAELVLIGAFGEVYTLTYHFNHEAFSFSDVPAFGSTWMAAIYFSVATLTSTGYGDIHARSDLAMALTTLEMLAGWMMNILFFSVIAGLAFRER